MSELGLSIVGDADALLPIVQRVLDDNPKIVEQYRGGKTSVIGFFVGQVMKATKGSADPKLVPKLLAKLLGGAEGS